MDTLLRKNFQTKVVESDSDQRRLTFTISTDAVDRDGDVLSPAGWDLSAYNRGSLDLWAHDYQSMPIAKTVTSTRRRMAWKRSPSFPRQACTHFPTLSTRW